MTQPLNFSHSNAFVIFASAVLALSSLSAYANNQQMYFNGDIYTVNPKQPWAESVLVEDGEITFVGRYADAKSLAKANAEKIDLDGQMMMPGIHDVHAHPLEARSPFSGTCLLDSHESNAEKFIRTLKRCAPNQIASEWIMGFGHSVFTLLDAERPPRAILDDAIPNRPAVIMEETSHSVWVNSAALKAAGIDRHTANPPGGVIVKDPNTGEPNGILFDSAGDLVMDLAWLPTPEIKDLNYEGLLEGIAELNRYGITSVVEARTYWKRGFEEAWLRAEAEETLTVRAVLALWAYPSQPDEAQINELKKRFSRDPSRLLNISQIKAYADGIVINTTSAMLQPYKETLGDIPSDNGLNYFSEERLKKYIRELGPKGFDFHIHAIGDRGVREALNAIESGQRPQQRHRLTHLEFVNPADYPRFKALNVIADMQVAGDFTQPHHWHENEPLVGELAHNFVPLKDLHNAGATITLSSDWDVSQLNPFIGIQNALTRTPQNLSSLHEVIKAYTINAAYSMRQEDRTGSIKVGKRADLVVLDRNIFTIPKNKIKHTQVDMTVLDGEIVYER